MKLVSHNGRVDVSGRHNDRNFNLSMAPHIDKERIEDNRYYTYNGNYDKSFQELEEDYYKKHFGKYLNAQNKRNTLQGHKERNKTIKKLHSGKHTRPEDRIIQIGNKDEHVTGEVLWEVAMEYQKRFDEIFGSNCKILDMALHLDEETPHIHLRRVWSYTDENGYERIGQTKALEELGIMAKLPGKEEGRYNNSKVTFTSQDRELLCQICKEKGIEIEEVSKTKRKHLSTPEYKALASEIEELELKRNSLKEEVEEIYDEVNGIDNLSDQLEYFLQNDFFQHLHDEQIEEAKKKSSIKRAAELIKIFKEEAEKVLEAENFNALVQNASTISASMAKDSEMRRLNHKVEILSRYIADNGLAEDFNRYIKNPKDRVQPREQNITFSGNNN